MTQNCVLKVFIYTHRQILPLALNKDISLNSKSHGIQRYLNAQGTEGKKADRILCSKQDIYNFFSRSQRVSPKKEIEGFNRKKGSKILALVMTVIVIIEFTALMVTCLSLN